MKIKNFLKFTVAVILLMALSVLLHEFVHFIQYHYIYKIPYDLMEMHFVWEIQDFSKYNIYNLPLAWVSAPECNMTVVVSDFVYKTIEPVAYLVQFTFVIIGFIIIDKTESLRW